jgi:hypothetical protein
MPDMRYLHNLNQSSGATSEAKSPGAIGAVRVVFQPGSYVRVAGFVGNPPLASRT